MSKVKITDKSCYAPIRFESRYSNLKEAFRKNKDLIVKNKYDYDETFLDNPCIKWLEDRYPNLNLDKSNIYSNIDTFTRFLIGGKIIYDLDDTLLSALSISDVDNISCGVVKFPSSAFYINLDNYSEVFEGVFILTNDIQNSGELADEVILEFVTSNFATRPMKSCLESGELTKSFELYFGNDYELVVDVFKNECTIDSLFLEQIKLTKNHETNELPVDFTYYSEMNKCLSIVLNIILYISSTSPDIVYDWGRDIPSDKISLISKQEDLAIKKNFEEGLYQTGYTKVKHIGRNFAQTEEGNIVSSYISSGKKLATHFRRGHFRNQTYGTNSELRKLVFIAPTIVNAGGEIQGVIYT